MPGYLEWLWDKIKEYSYGDSLVLNKLNDKYYTVNSYADDAFDVLDTFKDLAENLYGITIEV